MNFLIAKNSKKLLIWIFLAALLVRLIAYFTWLHTPFTEYSRLSGLDMMTHMEFGKDFAEGRAVFSFHKLLCYAAMKITGEESPVKAVVLAQFIVGAFLPLLVFGICRRLTAKKSAAFISAIFAALYSPLVMYESFTLIESLFVFFATLALWAALRFNLKNFREAFSCGVLILLPSLVRFSGIFVSASLCIFILWRLYRRLRKGRIKFFIGSGALYISGMSCVFAFVSIFNIINCGEWAFFPGKPVISYILKAGAEFNINPEDDLGDAFSGNKFEVERITAGYFSKLLDIIRPYEIPNNLNYYFIKNQYEVLSFLIGPMLMIPLAVSGFIVMLSHPKRLKRFSVLFLYFLSIALPMITFLPLARYRVSLLPLFAIFAGIFIIAVRDYLRISQQKPMPLLLSLLIYVIVLAWSAPSSFPLRSEDFVAYGKAMEHKGVDGEILAAYIAGYNLAPESQSAVVHLSDYLMRKSNFMDAKKVLENYCAKFNDTKVKLMLASAKLGCGEYLQAKELLHSIPAPKDGKARVNYFYQLGECHRLLNENETALQCYQTALEASVSDEERKIILNAISRFNKQ